MEQCLGCLCKVHNQGLPLSQPLIHSGALKRAGLVAMFCYSMCSHGFGLHNRALIPQTVAAQMCFYVLTCKF